MRMHQMEEQIQGLQLSWSKPELAILSAKYTVLAAELPLKRAIEEYVLACSWSAAEQGIGFSIIANILRAHGVGSRTRRTLARCVFTRTFHVIQLDT